MKRTTQEKYDKLRSDLKGYGSARYGNGSFFSEVYKENRQELKTLGVTPTGLSDILATYHETLVEQLCKRRSSYFRGLGYLCFEKKRVDPEKHTNFLATFKGKVFNPNWIYKARIVITDKGLPSYLYTRRWCKEAKKRIFETMNQPDFNCDERL